MRYMLLIYQNPATFEAFSEEELTSIFNEVDALMKELEASGEWVGGQGLADPSQARTVKVRDGVPAVTDGPFLEAKEYLAGYSIFECDSIERATELAMRWPDARWAAVELRQLMSGGDPEV